MNRCMIMALCWMSLSTAMARMVEREIPYSDGDKRFIGKVVYDDIRAVISIHGGLDSPAPQDGSNIRASVLMLHASHDPSTPPEQIAALVAEWDTHGVDWQLNYYAHHGHSFTDPEGSGYNRVADQRAWAALLLFLNEKLRSDNQPPEKRQP